METAFGGMGLLFLLLGGLALAGLAGGGDSDSEDTPDPDDEGFLPLTDTTPDEDLPPLTGTMADDSLTGDTSTGDILGLAGDDLIISAGANGTLDGGDGADGIALNSGEGTLTGGAGNDVFLITGDETSDTPTHGTITDFDPATDKLALSMQQSAVGAGQVPLSPQTAFLSITDTETADGPALVVEFAPRPGFESQTSEAGFAKATLLGVTSDDLTDTNFFIGVDRFEDDAEQRTLIETVVQGARSYDVFEIVSSEENFTYQDDLRNSEAVFGLGGDDLLAAADFQSVDLYGGPGNDVVSGGLFTSGSLFGGAGDDHLDTLKDNEMSGGEGVDTFTVTIDDLSLPETPPVITDFDPANETLSLNAYFTAGLNAAVGTQVFTLEDTIIDGVSGTLVSSFLRAADPEDDITGASVFLQGVMSADIPSGAITVDIRFL